MRWVKVTLRTLKEAGLFVFGMALLFGMIFYSLVTGKVLNFDWPGELDSHE